jgi:hypothetical protein
MACPLGKLHAWAGIRPVSGAGRGRRKWSLSTLLRSWAPTVTSTSEAAAPHRRRQAK